jgi:N-acetylglucosamine-6-sulfatase
MRVWALLFATVTATLVLVSVGALSLEPVIGDNRAEAQVAERPNIVFVLADDLNEQDMEQLAGIRTVMGSEGVTFPNAYVTYSLCCPSRASILRGQYGHNHDITGNSDPQGGWPKFRSLGHENSTMATWLNDAGYQTKYIGVYMTGYYYSTYRPPGWDEWYTMIGDPTLNNVNDNGTRTTLVGHSTDVYADKASDFIRRSSSNSAPFFAMIGTRAPHYPPPVADRYNDRFATAPLPRSPNFDETDISDKPQWVQPYGRLTSSRTTEMQDQYRNRLRSMLSVEDLLRQTIATLQETGELSNTYIFLTSDNGFHMGNHRLYPGGKWTPYEEDRCPHPGVRRRALLRPVAGRHAARVLELAPEVLAGGLAGSRDGNQPGHTQGTHASGGPYREIYVRGVQHRREGVVRSQHRSLPAQ